MLRLLCLWTFAAVLLAARSLHADTLFTDGDFYNSDWSQLNYISGNGSNNQTVEERPAGGIPGRYRYIQNFVHSSPGQASKLYGFSFKNSAVYDPAASGAISTVDWSQDVKFLFGEGGPSQDAAPALEQNGNIFAVSPPQSTSAASWSTISLGPLPSSSFYRFDIATLQFTGEHPDFSPAGAAITFGFVHSNTIAAGAAGIQPAVGVDNWRVQVNVQGAATPTPTPTAAPPGENAPVANAGQDFTAHRCCHQIWLDGSASYDPDDGPQALSYEWTQTAGPGDTFLQHSETFRPYFAPKCSDPPECRQQVYYGFGLTVSDGLSSSLPDYVNVLVLPFTEPACWLYVVQCRVVYCPYLNMGYASRLQPLSQESDLETRVKTFRGVRDKLLAASGSGRRYIQLYEKHNAEILELLDADPSLAALAAAMLDAIKPALDAELSGQGAGSAITAGQIEAVTAFLDALGQKGGASLASDIAAERAGWGPLENYVGKSIEQAQEELLSYGLYLPRAAGTISVTNTGTGEAAATVSFYSAAGELADTRELQVAAKGVVRTAAPKNTAAIVLSNKPVKAVAANSREAVEAGAGYRGLLFPVFRLRGGIKKTLISVQNTSPEANAAITLRYYDEQGAEIGSVERTLPPNAYHLFDSAALLGAGEHRYAAAVEADGAVAGSVQVQSDNGLAGMRALDEWDAGSKLYAVFGRRQAAREGGSSEIYVWNRSGEQAEVSVSYYKRSGKRAKLASRPIAAGGFAVFDAARLKAGNAEYAVIETESVSLAAQLLESGRGDERRLEGGNAIPEPLAGDEWICAPVGAAAAENSELKVLNAGTAAAEVTLGVHDPASGSLSSSRSFSLGAGKLRSIPAARLRQAGRSFKGAISLRGSEGSKLIVTSHMRYSQDTSGYACSAADLE